MIAEILHDQCAWTTLPTLARFLELGWNCTNWSLSGSSYPTPPNKMWKSRARWPLISQLSWSEQRIRFHTTYGRIHSHTTYSAMVMCGDRITVRTGLSPAESIVKQGRANDVDMVINESRTSTSLERHCGHKELVLQDTSGIDGQSRILEWEIYRNEKRGGGKWCRELETGYLLRDIMMPRIVVCAFMHVGMYILIIYG